jgi:hypothetical protein
MTNTCQRVVFDGTLPIVPSYQQYTAEELTSCYVNTDLMSTHVTQQHKAKTSQYSIKRRRRAQKLQVLLV